MPAVNLEGYRLKPVECVSAAEVMERAARSRAFRSSFGPKPTGFSPQVYPSQPDPPVEKKELVLPPPSGLLTQILWPDEYTGNNFTRPTIRQVARAMALAYKMDYARIVGPERLDAIVRPRQLAMALAKHLTLASYPAIGRAFGGRDHTTALHAIRKFAPIIETTASIMPIGAPLMEWVHVARETLERIRPVKQPRRTKIGLFCRKHTNSL